MDKELLDKLAIGAAAISFFIWGKSCTPLEKAIEEDVPPPCYQIVLTNVADSLVLNHPKTPKEGQPDLKVDYVERGLFQRSKKPRVRLCFEIEENEQIKALKKEPSRKFYSTRDNGIYDIQITEKGKLCSQCHKENRFPGDSAYRCSM